ncbi:hypothetical protein [Antribacter gilvus]|uniref:hypothetical protein n=1 Tax=Antribacter gilvus TaxID=2304675 RepID=UPI000F796670|nr:hypothetical protein [Antribacter gilvus]
MRTTRLTLTGVLVAASALLTGCSGPVASTTLADAPGHYESVLADVRAAVDGALDSELGWVADSDAQAVLDDDGRCTFSTASYEVEDLDVSSTDWDRVVDAVGPVLEGHGFELDTTGADVGGWLVVTAEDDAGARFRLAAKGRGELGIDGALVTTGEDGACAQA